MTVSVVMPCYRGVATLERAIQSVRSQTELPDELIVVDDASDDGSDDLLRQLAGDFPLGWMKVATLPANQGAASARNRGWDMAHGEFVAFLDADDNWHPRKLEIQLAFMRAHPDIAVSGHAHAINAPWVEPPLPPAWREVAFSQLLLRNPFVTPSVMLQRKLLLRFNERQRHMEDFLLWQRAAATGHRIARLEPVLVNLPKAQFGASGLSAELLKMEQAELLNYRLLHRDGYIGMTQLLALQAFSMAKFVRRFFIVVWRRRPQREDPR
jgi:glycosyltransferase involved in cell wall biosynthesis